jgi:hypothetical protein
MKTIIRKSKRVYKNKGRQSKKIIVRKIKNKKSIRSIKNKKIYIAKGVKQFSLWKPLPIIQNGIHIENEIIKKISGPVSFYYLKPIKVKEQGIDYPLLMLFGDNHMSRDNMCAPCNNEEGCYQIYDNSFLKLLDTVSSIEKPIDIYFEAFEVNKSAENYSFVYSETHENPMFNINNITPIQNYQNLFFNCFKHIKRDDLHGYNVLGKKCPTKTIRWQYADVRFCDNDCIEGQIKKYCQDILHENQTPTTEFEKSLNDLVIQFKNTENYLDFSTELFNNFLTIENKSLIRKQINKQQNLKLKDINFWINMYAESLNNYNLMYNNSNFLFFILISNSLLDIYTILRMMKTSNVTSIQPTICMIYLGNVHILNMVEIFTRHLGYSTDYNIEKTDPINRCLEITKPINLSHDVEEHNRMRDLPL